MSKTKKTAPSIYAPKVNAVLKQEVKAYDPSVRLAPGTVIFAEVDNGGSVKVRPLIVVSDDERIHAICGSTKNTSKSTIENGEFGVYDKQHLDQMGLKSQTRFSWIRGHQVYLAKRQIVNISGTCPEAIHRKMAMAYGLSKR